MKKLTEADIKGRPVIKCSNGRFAGVEDDGILVFRGIPFAKPPVGPLRWKKTEPPENSDELFDASKFGKSGPQMPSPSEQASMNEKSEDCLTLNIWTADTETKKKPIMFYIHGGGFSYGGSCDPLYEGKYMVKEHKDIVMISTNYRIGVYGFADTASMPGGEDFPDGPYLAVYDLIQSLKWVKENAESFGGDPENITIFGESAGGAMVSILLIVEEAKGLFQKVIAHSGTLNFLFTKEEMDCAASDGGGETDGAVLAEKGELPAAQEEPMSEIQALAAMTGCSNMDELMALSEEELYEAYITVDEECGMALNDIYSMPLKGEGGIIPEDPYEAIRNGAGEDVTLMIGTVANEFRYWVELMDEQDFDSMSPEERNEKIQNNLAIFREYMEYQWVKTYESSSDEEKANLDKFLEIQGDEDIMWKQCALIDELGFRIPAIEVASGHADAGGKTYMYRFDKKSKIYDWLGACHAIEVPYAMHNLTATQFAGEINKELADAMCQAWTNFARTGDPSTQYCEWNQYDSQKRDTMIFGDDNTVKVESDPWKERRELLEFTLRFTGNCLG